MTLYELGVEYEKSAAPIRKRLSELRAQLRAVEQPEEIWHIKRRISELTPLLTECNKTAMYLKRYYDKGYFIGNGPHGREHKLVNFGDVKHRTVADCAMHIEHRANRETATSDSGVSTARANVSRLSGRKRRKQIDSLQELLQGVKET